MIKIAVDTTITLLSSESRTFKSQHFIEKTRHFKDIDAFISKISEALLTAGGLFEYGVFEISTEDKEHTFTAAWGKKLTGGYLEKDIVFFDYHGRSGYKFKNDTKLSAILAKNVFSLYLREADTGTDPRDLNKVYRLSNSDSVNFPLLSRSQAQLVAIEDQNVLVQGVAGSGKTNVCIDKIIFSACKAYGGRVLYSTFSRGLLLDTRSKVRQFKANLDSFLREYTAGRVVFADADHKKAVENRLGVFFDVHGDANIIYKIKGISKFLDEKVDYLLIEDFFAQYAGETAESVGESFFLNTYVRGIKDHQLAGKLDKLKNLSYEVIYKEIYGVILGCFDVSQPSDMLTLEQYLDKRKNSFSRMECDMIYSIAKGYEAYLKENGLTDNNLMSRKLLSLNESIPKYSLAVLDEVQDLTEVNLCFMKGVARKLFCVGDALQMINPSYFSFAYLKRLLFEKDTVTVAELQNNYRNSKKIAEVIDRLADINKSCFGTHSFVLRGKSIESDVPTSTLFVKDKRFMTMLAGDKFNNYTVIVSDAKQKQGLRKIMKKQEILTVSEVKGLERDVVVLYNVLSSNADKWHELERASVNRKQADENSVYRYYFNLFYVGISRAKTHIYVAEDKDVALFSDFFKNNFRTVGAEKALEGLMATSDLIEAEQDELAARTEQFIGFGQYENARFTAEKILDENLKDYLLKKTGVYENFIAHGRYKEAGVRYWEYGFIEEAREQFELSGDRVLSELMDACRGESEGRLDFNIIDFYPDVISNETAKGFIEEVILGDLMRLEESQKDIKKRFKNLKERTKNGK